MCSTTERRHQALGYVTPDEVYRAARGGGARIVDHFGETAHTPPPETQQEREHRGRAVPLHVTGSPLHSMHACLDGGVHCKPVTAMVGLMSNQGRWGRCVFTYGGIPLNGARGAHRRFGLPIGATILMRTLIYCSEMV